MFSRIPILLRLEVLLAASFSLALAGAVVAAPSSRDGPTTGQPGSGSAFSAPVVVAARTAGAQRATVKSGSAVPASSGKAVAGVKAKGARDKGAAAGANQYDVISFPAGQSMGDLFEVTEYNSYNSWGTAKGRFAKAQGDVKFPKGTRFMLELSYWAGEHPDAVAAVDASPIVAINARNLESFDDKTLAALVRFKNVEDLNLDSTDVSDKGLVALKSLKHLKSIDLRKTLITGAGLTVLGSIATVERLAVGYNQIDDESLAKLEPLKKLVWLYLPSAQLSDRALLHVAKIKSLENLEIFKNAKITDKGIGYLAALPNLHYVTAYWTGVDVHVGEQLKRFKHLKSFMMGGPDFPPQQLPLVQKSVPGVTVCLYHYGGVASPTLLAPLH